MFYLVEDYEQNLAYDSYFYATLFDPETKEIFTQEYGSTAYAGGAHTIEKNGTIKRFVEGKGWVEVEYRECTPDVRELYDRVRTINMKLKYRKEMIEIAKDLNLTTYHEARKLTQAFPGWDRYEWNNRNYFEFKAVAQLLRTRVFRSSFRQSLRDQVLVWLGESVNRFEKPLSPRQLAMITRR